MVRLPWGNLKAGDIILGVNGQSIADANQLRQKIGMMAAGTEVKLNVLRDGHGGLISVHRPLPSGKSTVIGL